MVTAPLALSVLLATLALFAAVGFAVRGSSSSLDSYLIARGTQRAGTLGLSFVASGMGAWVLFAPAEVGAFVGAVGVSGYALGAAAPLVVFAFVGPRLRRVVPAGHSLTGFLRVRFGRTVHAFIVAVSVAYMLVFVTAELTAVGAVTGLLAGLDPRITVLAVAGVTLAYTAYGGLRASLRTDRWQAWLLFGLLAAAAVAMLGGGPGDRTAPLPQNLLRLDWTGLEAAVTLIIAVTVANVFHQGYWQRVWAAADDVALRRGAALGIAGVVPVVAVCGLLGMVAAGRGLDLGEPAAPFFALMGGLPGWVGLVAVVLGVALVTSSVDTLENGLAALVAAERPRMSLGTARLVTVGLMVPAVAVALQGYSVLRLFLIADLLCAAVAAPALLALWPRATPAAALAGGVSGLVGAVAAAVGASVLAGGTIAAGLLAVTFPGPPTLAPFAGALVGSTVVTVVVSLLSGRRADLGEIGGQVTPLSRSPR